MKARYNRHKVSYQRKLRYFRRRRDEARYLFMLALMEQGTTENVAKTIELCENFCGTELRIVKKATRYEF